VTDPLFQPYTMGSLELANRLVMAPMTRSRAIDNVPNDLMAAYYRQRAGAGLIVTEGTSPSPHGLGYPRIPGAYSEAQTAGWKKVADAVHERNAKIFLQLMHTGRVAHPANLPEGAEVLAPSAVALETTKMWVDAEGGEQPIPAPRAMTGDEVEAAIEEFVTTAKNAVAAGLDGVELHGANGYLIEQFIHPHTNRRDDEWGGSVEKRIRFAVEVAQRTVEAIGADRVGIRLSPHGVFNEMPPYGETLETYVALTKELKALGLVYLHVVDHSSMGTPPVPQSTKDALREAFGSTLILSGGYDAERARADLEAGRGELVAFGRPYLANPDLEERFRQGAALEEPRSDLFYAPGPEGYTDYPTLAEK